MVMIVPNSANAVVGPYTKPGHKVKTTPTIIAKMIAMSGGDSSGRMDLRQDAVLLGAAASLRKPFEREDLIHAVAAALGGKP